MTLVEVLSVTAIVGVLAALLVPGLGTARDKARAAACVNQLRQLTHAGILYHDDFGRWPGGAMAGYFLWNGADYVGAGNLLAGPNRALAPSFYCPAARLFPRDAADTGLQNLGQPGRMTVGNYFQRGWNQGLPERLGGSAVAWLGDICFPADVARNHAGGLNVACTDGRVQFVPRPAAWEITAAHAWDDLDALTD